MPDIGDNDTLPSLQIKVENMEEDSNVTMNNLLHTPSPMRRSIVNDTSTISSNITMDTRMDTVEGNIGNLDKSLNHITHLLTNFMQEMKQGSNQAPTNHEQNHKAPGVESKTITNSTTVTEDTVLSD